MKHGHHVAECRGNGNQWIGLQAGDQSFRARLPRVRMHQTHGGAARIVTGWEASHDLQCPPLACLGIDHEGSIQHAHQYPLGFVLSAPLGDICFSHRSLSGLRPGRLPKSFVMKTRNQSENCVPIDRAAAQIALRLTEEELAVSLRPRPAWCSRSSDANRTVGSQSLTAGQDDLRRFQAVRLLAPSDDVIQWPVRLKNLARPAHP